MMLTMCHMDCSTFQQLMMMFNLSTINDDGNVSRGHSNSWMLDKQLEVLVDENVVTSKSTLSRPLIQSNKRDLKIMVQSLNKEEWNLILKFMSIVWWSCLTIWTQQLSHYPKFWESKKSGSHFWVPLWFNRKSTWLRSCSAFLSRKQFIYQRSTLWE